MQLFEKGIDYLKIDIANNFGLDKEDWDTRIEWFEENKNHLGMLIKKAETPALYFAGINAYNKAINSEPSGYPISLDATSSGLQLLACMTGDRKAAELCNVVNIRDANGKVIRADAYTIIYKRMLEVINEEGRIKRDDTKQAIMTSLYGSQAIPKEIFGEGILLNVFENTMDKSAPVVWELNKIFLNIWDPEKTCNSWVLPDNFHVHVKVMAPEVETVHFLNAPYEVSHMVNKGIEDGRSHGANTTHSVDGLVVREMSARCNHDVEKVKMLKRIIKDVNDGYQPSFFENENTDMVKILWNHYEESGYLSARIMDYLDYENVSLVDHKVIEELVYSLPPKPFEVISVHDCFRCLPNYANDLRKQYNRQLYLIARSDILSYILSQLVGRKVSIGKDDPEMYKEILDAEYALS